MICHFSDQCVSAPLFFPEPDLSAVELKGWRFQSSTPGTYKSEENQLLLKVYQVKGPTQHYISKFKNDNWAMDGYVSDAVGAAGCLFLAWSFRSVGVLKEYICIVLRECGFLFWVLDSHSNRQQQTKTRRINFCVVFMEEGGGALFLSALVSATRPSHYPLMQ